MSNVMTYKRSQLAGKRAAFYIGDRGQFATTPDGRWFYTLDEETFVGPYKRRIQVERAYRAHLEKRKTVIYA